MKTKYIDKRSWRRLLKKHYKEIRVRNEWFDGIIGEIEMIKVKSPLEITIIDQSIVVADNGFRWLQILPKDKHYSITVMYDAQDKPLQYYFDINEENIVEMGEARTHDLYLDVLVLPDGRYELVDEADVKRALKKQVITQAQYDLAYKTAQEVIDEVKDNFTRFEQLASKCKAEIKTERT
ncbi:DUF402 domain-containing protein [Macrococcoides caseolyticum]|uniref:DUF402 domain-containing protein n=1 Tax=Macrococcoides caseolyticum TaxID=69966 RepID=UPI000C3392C0|nr:DUF402 domain-containing protein [Macrococcus caseolyticus]PKE12938.1 hypothetical protein CW685_02690 [Macrococcus caseolyticus]PKE48106.1 hypothetical protein CW677_04755 [Macrococcus caseolyticus]PKF15095.1 hypothetical protein CW690_05030 [Macrococcus caseolyticus]PNZ73153.1 DUF402 domain-containing protein [Macrococcus caseolyticus]QPT45832.1 DUF402 domain-containing protein [Macrococcus caseolyticus]